MSSRFVSLATVAAVCLTGTGCCTLIGAIVGSAIPRYERIADWSHPPPPDKGDRLRVTVQHSPSSQEASSVPRYQVTGKFVGQDPAALQLQVLSKPMQIQRSQIIEFEIDHTHGIEGLLIGLGCDAVLVAIVTVALISYSNAVNN